MGKDSFIKVLVEMHIPINTNMLDLFNQIFRAVSREFLMELAGNLGKSAVGRRAASSHLARGESHLRWSMFQWILEYNFQPNESFHKGRLFCRLVY